MNRVESYIHQRNYLRSLFLTQNGKIVVVQKPNPPLYGFVIGAYVSALTSGTLSSIAGYIAYVSIAYWALLEVRSGVTLFRRLLGWVSFAACILVLILHNKVLFLK